MPELSELRVLDKEERTILNPARTEVDYEVRLRLWKAFAEERQRQIDADCGNIERAPAGGPVGARRAVDRCCNRRSSGLNSGVMTALTADFSLATALIR